MSDTLTETTGPPAPAATRPRRSWVKIVATAVLLVVLVLLPVLVGSQVAYLKLAQYVLIGAVGGIGLTLIVGQAGQLSLAHPFFLLLGAVSYAVLGGDPAETPDLVSLHWPPLLAGDRGGGHLRARRPRVRPRLGPGPWDLPGGRVVVAGVPRALARPVARDPDRRHGQRQAATDVRAVRLPVRQHHTRPDGCGRCDPEATTAVVPVPGLRHAGLRAGPGRRARPDRAGVAGGARQRGRRGVDGCVRRARQGGRVHDLVGVRGPGGRDDRALAGPRQARRERVHRQLLVDGLDRLPGDHHHRRARVGARRRDRRGHRLRAAAVLPAGCEPVRLVRRRPVRRPVGRHPRGVHLRPRHSARRCCSSREGRPRSADACSPGAPPPERNDDEQRQNGTGRERAGGRAGARRVRQHRRLRFRRDGRGRGEVRQGRDRHDDHARGHG